jgi:hypothetical protein
MTYEEKRRKVVGISRRVDAVLDPPKELGAITVEDPEPFKCAVSQHPDGSLLIEFVIAPSEAKRIKSRAGVMELSRYIYENILFRAVSDHVY